MSYTQERRRAGVSILVACIRRGRPGKAGRPVMDGAANIIIRPGGIHPCQNPTAFPHAFRVPPDGATANIHVAVGTITRPKIVVDQKPLLCAHSNHYKLLHSMLFNYRRG